MSKKKAKPDIEATSEVVESKPVGRPTMYDPKYCEMLIAHMEQGLSFESFGGVIGHHKQTLYEWAQKFPEFGDAKRLGTEKSRLWWEKTGHAGMFMGGKDNPFNATIWVFSMKNRFGWRDRTEVIEKPVKSMTDDELMKEAEEILAKKKKVSDD
jgi:hypothetical protein